MNVGGPAFPSSTKQIQEGAGGMSLRDYFAGQALTGVMANSYVAKELQEAGRLSSEDIVFTAYKVADLMIKKRQNETKSED